MDPYWRPTRLLHYAQRTHQPIADSTLFNHRRFWPSTIQLWTVLSVAGGVSTEYNLIPIQCLLNVRPASPVLAIIHSDLVSNSCWRKCVHTVYTAPMLFKCWPASYTMTRHRNNVRYTNILQGLCSIDYTSTML